MTAARSYCRSQRCCNSCTVFFQPHDFAIMMARIGRRSNISSSFLVIDLTVSGCNPSETGRDIAIDIVRLLVTLNRCINIARFLRNCCVYYVMFFIIKRSVVIKCFFFYTNSDPFRNWIPSIFSNERSEHYLLGITYLCSMSKKLLSLFVFLFTASTAGWSQCAMCKAVVESDMENGGTTAAGLNSGILYLMVFPYLLIATIGFF